MKFVQRSAIVSSDGFDSMQENLNFCFKFSGITSALRNMCRVKFEVICSDIQILSTNFLNIESRLDFIRAIYLTQLPNSGRSPVTFDILVLAELDTTINPAVASERIVKGNSSMLNDSTFSDFTFVVRGREFKVHKCILATASPVLAKMFTTDMTEARSNKCPIEHIRSDTFRSLLEYVYAGNFRENFSSAEAAMLYDAAHYFEIKDLIKTCYQHIQNRLTVNNALALYQWAQPYDMGRLKADAWLFIKR